jgi:hypothetical protein
MNKFLNKNKMMYLKNIEITNDITYLHLFDNFNNNIYVDYFKENLLLNLVDNNTILSEIKTKSLKYVNNKLFKKDITTYFLKYASLDFKQTIFNNAYNNSINNNSSIDSELLLYFDNISNEDIVKIAYFTLITFYVIKNYI